MAFANDHVTICYEVRFADSAWKVATISAAEFLRWVALHVVLPGFVRIRYFGFLAHRNRCEAIAKCRKQLEMCEVEKAAQKVEAEKNS